MEKSITKPRPNGPEFEILPASYMVCGISFHRSPVAVREKVAVPPEKLPEALRFVAQQRGVRECMLLSTCNRTEFYLSAEEWAEGAGIFLRFAREIRGFDLDEAADQVYVFRGGEAVAHLFRVASGLDSLVLGETQILGQVKRAFREAENQGCVERDLHRWIPSAFTTAKRVRSDSGIGECAVSAGSAAVELAEKIFEDLSGKKVVLLGAGKMGDLAALHLKQAGAVSIAVVNRTLSRAAEVASKCAGTAVAFERRLEQIAEADVVICSTDAPSFILDAESVRAIMRLRPHRPLLLLDISVPRNIDPRVAAVDGVFLYSVDDLDRVVEANREQREKQAWEAEKIINAALERFVRDENQNRLGPAIAAIRNQVHSICRDELARLEHRMPGLSAEHKAELELLLHRIAQKIVHPVIMELKTSQARDSSDQRLSRLRQIFGIECEGTNLGLDTSNLITE